MKRFPPQRWKNCNSLTNRHSWYLLRPSRLAVVYFFCQKSAFLGTISSIWAILMWIYTFWRTFYRKKVCWCFKIDKYQLCDQINAMMEVGKNHFVTPQGYKQRTWQCKVCGKEAHKTHIIGHIEAKHIISKVLHSCDICGKVSKTRDGLRRHKSRDGCRDHKAAFSATS